MAKLKVGIIGMGGIASIHQRCLERCDEAEIAAVCDIVKERADKAAAANNCPAFYSHEELLAKADVDAITIGTPHYDHMPIAIHALDAGKHVLTEKPIAVHVNDAQKMVDAGKRHPELVFSAMFQMRVDPAMRKVKQLLDSGEIGPLRRISWTITTWFRTQSYYDSGGWRATWGGEGGGVLLNQCPHNLDLMQWFFGLPERLSAHCAIGKYHHIEVEDEVVATLHYPGGAVGTFVTSTAEAPGVNRLEIAGDRGLVVIEGGAIRFYRTVESVKGFLDTSPERFATPEMWTVEVPARGEDLSHFGIMKNFVSACLHGEPLVAPAIEGINSVMLGNAMLLSGLEGREVTLPLDGDAYEAKLNELIAGSTFKKKVGQDVNLSLEGSDGLKK